MEQTPSAFPKLKTMLCNVCETGTVLLIKRGTNFSAKQNRWPYIFQCQSCTAAVGCHPNTVTPLGPLAPAHIRSLRAKAHSALDPLWESGLMTRSDAYAWLAKQLNVGVPILHITDLNEDQLRQAIYLAKEYFAARQNTLARRRKKVQDKLVKKNDAHRKHVIRRKKQR